MIQKTIHRLFSDVVLATQFVVAVVAALAALVLATITYDISPVLAFGAMVTVWFAIYGVVALTLAVWQLLNTTSNG